MLKGRPKHLQIVEKQTKFVVLGLLLFVIGSGALTWWFIAGKPEPQKAQPTAAAKPAEAVDWNKVYYETAPDASAATGTLTLGNPGN